MYDVINVCVISSLSCVAYIFNACTCILYAVVVLIVVLYSNTYPVIQSHSIVIVIRN